MERSFLQAYLDAFHRIEGWFQFDAALLFMAYNQFLAQRGIAGDVLEIGVHHGLSSIAIAALRGPCKRFWAVDLFEDLQRQNVSGSGGGNRRLFEANMREFHPDAGFLRIFARPSSELDARELGAGFSFCHIDGGHSAQETYHDLHLCHSILLPGGLLALDDYFNPEYPGVCEGAVEFSFDHPQALQPLAIGYNKVLFEKLPAAADLNSEFLCAFPGLEHKIVRLWDAPTILLASVLRDYVDLYASTPQRLVRLGSLPPRATFAPLQPAVRARRGETVALPVTLANTSKEVFPAGERVLGLSYHLRSATGELLRHDNDRAWLLAPLHPGEDRTLTLSIQAPPEPGLYALEVDLVWEQVMWFKDVGNPTTTVPLTVED